MKAEARRRREKLERCLSIPRCSKLVMYLNVLIFLTQSSQSPQRKSLKLTLCGLC